MISGHHTSNIIRRKPVLGKKKNIKVVVSELFDEYGQGNDVQQVSTIEHG
jgi:hypothetical protein